MWYTAYMLSLVTAIVGTCPGQVRVNEPIPVAGGFYEGCTVYPERTKGYHGDEFVVRVECYTNGVSTVAYDTLKCDEYEPNKLIIKKKKGAK